MTSLRKMLPAPLKNILRPVYYGCLAAGRLLARLAVRATALIFGKKLFLKIVHALKAETDTTVEVAGFRLEAADPIPLHRALNFLTREPDTLAWIDDYVEDGDVFYDIGANVGVFSLYSAGRKNAKVISFEPFADNFSLLNHNIFLNNLGANITALNLAIHDETTLSSLNVSAMSPGKAGHSFENPIGSGGGLFEPAFTQGMVGMTLDDFIATLGAPVPNHIKIDVDGNDHKIILGMPKTIRDSKLQSIAIELKTDWPEQMAIIEEIQSHGFRMLSEERYVNQLCFQLGSTRNHFFVRTSEK